MIKYLIKSKVNSYANSIVLENTFGYYRYTKWAQKNYVAHYLLEILLFFVIVAAVCIGIASEEPVLFRVDVVEFESVNYYNFCFAIIVAPLFMYFTFHAYANNKWGENFTRLAKILYQSGPLRRQFLSKMIWLHGYGFRMFVASVLAIFISIPIYFDHHLLLLLVLSLVLLSISMMFYNAIELLLYLFMESSNVNSNIAALVIGVFAYVIYSFINTNKVMTITDYTTLVVALFVGKIVLSYFATKILK